jgi:hypothetical protein
MLGEREGLKEGLKLILGEAEGERLGDKLWLND